MLMVLHGNDGVHTHNRGSKDILGATTHYTPVMTIKYGTALKSKTDYKLDLMARADCLSWSTCLIKVVEVEGEAPT